MYYLLKDNVFYLKTEKNGIFMKNNLCTVNIKNANSYKLFQMLLPILNGKTNVEQEIEKVENNKAKSFLKNFINILVQNKFVLFSEFPIDMSRYDAFTGSLLYCYGSNDLPKESINNIARYEICSADATVNKTIEDVVGNGKDLFVSFLNDEKYILIKYFNSNNKNLYIYKPKKEETVIISSMQPSDEDTDPALYALPMHIFEVLSALIKIELKLDNCGIDSINFSKKDYVFDLMLLTGRPEQRGSVYEN